jgi:hypothetical protein
MAAHQEGANQTCVKPNIPTHSAILHKVKNIVRKLLLSAVSRSRSSRSCSARWQRACARANAGQPSPEIPSGCRE